MSAEYEAVAEELRTVRQRMESLATHAQGLRNAASKKLQQAEELDLKAAREQLFVDHLEASLAEIRERDQEALRRAAVQRPSRGRCDDPCGKVRFTSRDDARRRGRSIQLRMIPYYSTACRCWHLTSRNGR